MVKIFTKKQAKEIDILISKKIGLSNLVMMENVGIRIAEFVKKLVKDKKRAKIAVICGRGNNGGDGLVVARQLFSDNFKVEVYLLSRPIELSDEARINFNILKKLNFKFKFIIQQRMLKTVNFSSYSVLVDAIFGIGLDKEVKGIYRKVIEKINNSSVKVVSIDIPSGLDADRGIPLGIAVKADYTITLIAPKKGLFVNQGPYFSGKILTEHIGCKI